MSTSNTAVSDAGLLEHNNPNPQSIRALEMRIGELALAMPVDQVQQFIEYTADPPPPGAALWVGGMGLHGDRVLMSILLADSARAQPPRRREVKGVLIRFEWGYLPCAVEVDGVHDFILVTPLSPQDARLSVPHAPEWLGQATAPAGRVVAWLDPSVMFRVISR